MNIVVAVNSDWGVGYNNAQSVVIPEDRHRFHKLTRGGIVVVGRKTFEEIGKSLTFRKNIVMTRDRGFRATGVVAAHSIDGVLATIADEDTNRVYIIGGGSIYNLFLPMCSHAYVTKIEASPQSDVFFPNLDESPDWELESKGETRESNGIRYSFDTYRKCTMYSVN